VTIAARMAVGPLEQWIVPQWWGAWGMEGLFREHPVGIFIVPALLSRLGVPTAGASYAFNLFCQAACLLLLVALARRLVPQLEANLLAWALPLVPIAFVFRVRANQEYPLLLGMLLALYGVARAHERSAWLLVACVGFAWALLVKGVFALLAPVYAALWLLLLNDPGTRRQWVGWLGVVGMLAVAPLAAAGYERAYAQASGHSFLDYYLGARMALGGGAGEGGELSGVAAAKLWNTAWYAARVIWYAAPWSVALVLFGRGPQGGSARFARFALAGTLATVLLLALRDTRADRYVFPAYFLAAAGGILVAHARSARLRACGRTLDRWWPWGPALLWFGLVAARVALG